MSLSVFHGEHINKSREALNQALDALRQKQVEIININGKNLEMGELQTTLLGQGLFGDQPAVVIDNLLSQPKSKKKAELTKLIEDSAATMSIFLWEGKQLTAVQKKSINAKNIQEFPLPSVLFSWLDNLHSPVNKRLTLLRQVLQQEEPQLALSMLIRQFRMILTIKSGGTLQGHPFVIKKTTIQAKSFSLEQLKKIYDTLVTIEYTQKTGQATLILDQELEQLMMKL